KTPFQAALDSAHEISVPVLMATVTTVIVFLPLVFMTGMGKFLFTPLAISVALAMFASYVVSRTVSPLMCARLLRPARPGSHGHGGEDRFPRWLLVVATLLVVVAATAYAAQHYAFFALLPVPRWLLRRLTTGELYYQLAGIAGLTLWAAALLYRVSPRF